MVNDEATKEDRSVSSLKGSQADCDLRPGQDYVHRCALDAGREVDAGLELAGDVEKERFTWVVEHEALEEEATGDEVDPTRRDWKSDVKGLAHLETDMTTSVHRTRFGRVGVDGATKMSRISSTRPRMEASGSDQGQKLAFPLQFFSTSLDCCRITRTRKV